MNSIGSRPVRKPVHIPPFYRDNDFVSTGVGEDVFARGLCLPSEIKMTEEEQDTVIEVICGAFP